MARPCMLTTRHYVLLSVFLSSVSFPFSSFYFFLFFFFFNLYSQKSLSLADWHQTFAQSSFKRLDRKFKVTSPFKVGACSEV